MDRSSSVGLCCMMIAFGFMIGACEEGNDVNILKKQAIEKGFAEYNQTTGKWQWKGEDK